MAGLAFLPWEDWIRRLLHRFAVAVRRWLHKRRRQWALTRSQGWPETEGTLQRINWDSSWPREEIVYSYSTEHGRYSGFYWQWFESPVKVSENPEQHVGDKVRVRYGQDDPADSIFMKFC
jgi:hypothetical protein